MNENKMVVSEIQHLTLLNEEYDSPILDIGGGGEGVIGKVYGKDVIAIDIRKDELEETKNDALKIVMDATDLKFLDNSFPTATLFFTLMYMKHEIKIKTLKEIYRVLNKKGILDIFETNMPAYKKDEKEVYVLQLNYKINDKEVHTGYGCSLQNKMINKDYYLNLLRQIGFKAELIYENKEIFRIRAK